MTVIIYIFSEQLYNIYTLKYSRKEKLYFNCQCLHSIKNKR